MKLLLSGHSPPPPQNYSPSLVFLLLRFAEVPCVKKVAQSPSVIRSARGTVKNMKEMASRIIEDDEFRIDLVCGTQRSTKVPVNIDFNFLRCQRS
jgi:hypothetical protein